MAACLHLSTLIWEYLYGLEAPLTGLARRIESSLQYAGNRHSANDDSFR